jgi:hypothetical protein
MASLRMQKSNCKMQNCGIRLRRMADFIDFCGFWLNNKDFFINISAHCGGKYSKVACYGKN